MPKRKTCLAFTRELVNGVYQLVPCGAKAHKVRLCHEHYAHARELASYRGHFNAVNIKRRLKNAAGLSGRQWTKLRKEEQRKANAERQRLLQEARQATTVEASYEG